MGTAGHCILGESPVGGDVGEESWAPGTGPVASDADGNRIGEFAYAILQDPKDFAVIRLDAGVEASPQMCHFGGPTGTNTDHRLRAGGSEPLRQRDRRRLGAARAQRASRSACPTPTTSTRRAPSSRVIPAAGSSPATAARSA